MILEGYAILNEKESLKLLCFRGGYSLKSLISANIYSGSEIVNLLSKELNLTNRYLKIKETENYMLYKVTLKKQNLIFDKLSIFLRGFINGILVIKNKRS